jgi:hypothetical protein
MKHQFEDREISREGRKVRRGIGIFEERRLPRATPGRRSLERIDIVKRKRIRFAGRRTRGGDEGETFCSTTLAAVFRVLATSRDLSLTAKIPDVFEAKLVFSNRKTLALGV